MSYPLKQISKFYNPYVVMSFVLTCVFIAADYYLTFFFPYKEDYNATKPLEKLLVVAVLTAIVFYQYFKNSYEHAKSPTWYVGLVVAIVLSVSIQTGLICSSIGSYLTESNSKLEPIDNVSDCLSFKSRRYVSIKDNLILDKMQIGVYWLNTTHTKKNGDFDHADFSVHFVEPIILNTTDTIRSSKLWLKNSYTMRISEKLSIPQKKSVSKEFYLKNLDLFFSDTLLKNVKYYDFSPLTGGEEYDAAFTKSAKFDKAQFVGTLTPKFEPFEARDKNGSSTFSIIFIAFVFPPIIIFIAFFQEKD